MRRITNYLTGAFLLFLLLSCTNDGNDNAGKTDSLNQLKEELHLEKFSNANIAGNVEVNWNNTLQTEKKDVAIVEFDAKEKFPSKIQSSFLKAEMNYQLISIESEGELKNYFIEVFSYNDSEAYSKTITKLNKFRGVFNVFSLNGQNLGSIAIDHGNAKNISESKTLDFLAATINSFYYSSDITKKIPLCDGTYTQVVEQAQDRWRVVSSNGKILSVEYMDTVITRTTTILPYPCDGSGDRDAIILQRTAHYYTGDGKSYAGVSNLLVPFLIQKNIISDQLYPCPQSVLDQLKNATNYDIAKILEKFGASNEYNLVFVSEITKDATPAATQRISKFNYKIQISTDYSNATKLFRAGNILHEIGHAYFMSLKDDYSSNPPNLAVFDNYPYLFQGYVEKKYPNMYDAHHMEMANSYIDIIAKTLQEYNKNEDPNGLVPYQVYTDLAWGGLIGTPIFEEKFKLGSSDRLRIENRYACEQTGNSIGYNTGEVQSSVSKPCN